jgi:phosphoenolpyruvate carboxylase
VQQTLPAELKHLVRETVGLFGEVLKAKLGARAYGRIESTRKKMTALRGASAKNEIKILQERFRMLEDLTTREQFEFAQSFALMLELMNTCENAYRSHKIQQKILAEPSKPLVHKPDSVIYVLTAHPTEARAPFNIWIFHEILKILTAVLERQDIVFLPFERARLLHFFEVAWTTSLVRTKKPQVRDEAEHIYSTLLREETLRPLLRARQELAPIFVRSWVGGDKDGHPGVDEKVFLASLQLARQKLRIFCHARLKSVGEVAKGVQNRSILSRVLMLQSALRGLAKIKSGDAARVAKFRQKLEHLGQNYSRHFGSLHPELQELSQLFEMFPALVVPLEFRESSDVLMESPDGKGLAIDRMLQQLAKISRGGDPRAYVREFIISMAESIDHIRVAAHLVKKNLGEIYLPIVPLFEQARAQDLGVEIIGQMLRDRGLNSALKKYWNNSLEIMLGYSDSSKESGVLPSRLKVAETMYDLDLFCRKKHITPVFFQGSGGSVDRGGGSVEEQTSWWSAGALKNYKVTIQGEMVERSLANPEITWGQLEKISARAGDWRKAQGRRLPKAPVVDAFAGKVARHYQSQVQSPEFLQAVQKATPYSFLNLIKIGSRPSKRSKTVSVAGLRAIPWILCWTQTRILFPVWWGVGSAWAESSPAERKILIRSFETHPVFRTYVKALGFTLLKVEHVLRSKRAVASRKEKGLGRVFARILEDLRLRPGADETKRLVRLETLVGRKHPVALADDSSVEFVADPSNETTGSGVAPGHRRRYF